MLDNLSQPIVLALGYFDSVHIGHRKVIETAKKYALEHGALLVVFTFSGNLRAVLSRGEDKVVYLDKEREELLYSIGADHVHFAPTDFKFLSMGRLAFLNRLNKKLNIVAYVCGKDYRFGKFGKGTVSDLKRYADEKGQKVIVAETELFEGRKVSTSYIKRILSTGNIEKANQLLKTPYFITGTVYADRKMGHELGFPTMNVNINHEKHRLRDAVYAGHTYIDGKKYKVIINYGPRPTFDLTERLVEAHVVDFEGDLYGKEIKLCFDSYMREIQKFSGKESLRRQLEKDLESIKEKKND